MQFFSIIPTHCPALRQQSPGRAVLAANVMPLDVKDINYAVTVQISLIRRGRKLKGTIYNYRQQAQKRYKRDLDKMIHSEPRFVLSNNVFIERLSLSTTATENLAAGNFLKLRPCQLEQYKIISVELELACTIQDQSKNTAVSINPVNRTTNRTAGTKGDEEDNNDKEHWKVDKQARNASTPGEDRKYAFYRIVLRTKTLKGARYVLR